MTYRNKEPYWPCRLWGNQVLGCDGKHLCSSSSCFFLFCFCQLIRIEQLLFTLPFKRSPVLTLVLVCYFFCKRHRLLWRPEVKKQPTSEPLTLNLETGEPEMTCLKVTSRNKHGILCLRITRCTGLSIVGVVTFECRAVRFQGTKIGEESKHLFPSFQTKFGRHSERPILKQWNTTV